MALIVMAVYDTKKNGRTWMTRATLESLIHTIDWSKHRLIVSDNGSCKATHDVFNMIQVSGPKFHVIYNDENLGTAAAINRGWAMREPGENVVKLDNDVVIHQAGWLDLMEEAFDRDPYLGIIGLKRKDLAECPWGQGAMRSTLYMLPHKPGQRWIVVEICQHIMGTCQAYSSDLLDEIGGLYQMQDEGNKYGFDDSLASVRAHLAGFETVFLHGIEIDHIDPGQSEFTEWKQESAGKWMQRYQEVAQEYKDSTRPLYWKDAP